MSICIMSFVICQYSKQKPIAVVIKFEDVDWDSRVFISGKHNVHYQQPIKMHTIGGGLEGLEYL